jgi:transaldolase
VLFNGSKVEVRERMQNPVPKETLDTLQDLFPDFRRAYEPNGLTVDEFDGYGATVRTLRAFIGSYHEFVGLIRDSMIPNPDVK